MAPSSLILDYLGLLFVCLFTYVALSYLWDLFYTCYFGSLLKRSLNLRSLGSWAVVTGATDGLGRAYANELARRGLNVVLLSRSRYKLQTVAKEIEAQYGVETRILDVDFTGGAEIYERIRSYLADLDVGVLINNVGMSYPYPEFLSNVEDGARFCSDLINCNILSVTRMSLMVLPQMTEKKRGLILNVSSASALLPTPLLTMYSSTKAFVDKFSQDLALECRDLGVTVQCVLPGFVATNMSRIRKATLTVPSPAQFVQHQLNTLGLEVSSPGYWVHKIQFGLYQLALLLGRPFVERFSWYALLSVRSRAIRRRQHEEKIQSSPDKVSRAEKIHDGVYDSAQG